MGTHLRVLSESFLMNTNIDGFLNSFRPCALDESYSLSIGQVNPFVFKRSSKNCCLYLLRYFDKKTSKMISPNIWRKVVVSILNISTIFVFAKKTSWKLWGCLWSQWTLIGNSFEICSHRYSSLNHLYITTQASHDWLQNNLFHS